MRVLLVCVTGRTNLLRRGNAQAGKCMLETSLKTFGTVSARNVSIHFTLQDRRTIIVHEFAALSVILE